MSRWPLAVLAGVAVGIAAAIAGLSVAGWHLTVQATPSMLAVVPVGALVVLAPTAWQHLRVGELVGVRPAPASPPVVHWVDQVSSATLQTHNALSPQPDAWLLHPGRGELVGRAVAVIPGLGWVLSSWPVLACLVAGLVLVVATRRWWRLAGGMAGLYAAGLLWMAQHHPLASVRVVGQVASGHSATLVAVSTSLAPMRVHLTGATARAVRVVPGRLIRLTGHVAHLPAHLGWVGTAVLAWPWEVLLWCGIAAPAAVGVAVLGGYLVRDRQCAPADSLCEPGSAGQRRW